MPGPILLSVALWLTLPAWAQDYPSRPIKIVVSASPGGMTDVLPRVFAEKLNPIGLTPAGTTPERYMELMKADLVKYARIAKDAGIKAE